MMNTEFAFVSELISRDEVLEWMRKQEFNLEQLDTIVILDKLGHFAGTVPIARILLAAPEQHMSGIENGAAGFDYGGCEREGRV